MNKTNIEMQIQFPVCMEVENVSNRKHENKVNYNLN